ncbi:type IV pilus assembly protein PilV [Pseudomonas sp. TE3786]
MSTARTTSVTPPLKPLASPLTSPLTSPLIKTAGFSLVEILITTWLLSVGLLGMAALQGRAIAYGDDTLQRSTAAMLANDLLEQIRAAPGDWSRYLQSGPEQPAPAPPCKLPPGQPSAQVACWLSELAQLLPGSQALANGETYVCRSPAPGTCSHSGAAIEIQVAWPGNCAPGNTPCRYRVRSEI